MMALSRVLFAEDDPLVHAVLLAIFAQLGLEVRDFVTGSDALKAAQTEPFSVVVSDLRMPGATGIEVLKAAKLVSPAARLVLISGYADDDARTQVEALGGVLLHKPFGAADLRAAILG